MARYLLDSDVLIWILRGRQETVALVDRLTEEAGEAPACSALSVLEIFSGAKPTEVHKTAEFLDAVGSIPVDSAIARRAAGLLRDRKGRRDPREWIDACIASTALHHHLILVTYNQKDYPYPDLPLYPL